MTVVGLAHRAARDQALTTVRRRLEGAAFELRQALEETAHHHLGAHLALKLDRALIEIDGALKLVPGGDS